MLAYEKQRTVVTRLKSSPLSGRLLQHLITIELMVLTCPDYCGMSASATIQPDRLTVHRIEARLLMADLTDSGSNEGNSARRICGIFEFGRSF